MVYVMFVCCEGMCAKYLSAGFAGRPHCPSPALIALVKSLQKATKRKCFFVAYFTRQKQPPHRPIAFLTCTKVQSFPVGWRVACWPARVSFSSWAPHCCCGAGGQATLPEYLVVRIPFPSSGKPFARVVQAQARPEQEEREGIPVYLSFLQFSYSTNYRALSVCAWGGGRSGSDLLLRRH